MTQTRALKEVSLLKILLIGFGLSWLIASLMIGLTLLGATVVGAAWIRPKIANFTQAANTTLSEAIVTGLVGIQTTPTQTDQRTNLLILGLDSLDNRGDAPALTDTMMLISINVTNGEIKTISLPRDIWSETYQTRINALYHYGLEQQPTRPELYVSQIVTELTTVPIHHTVVITLDQLGQLIDLVGGVNINVPETFTDPLFPRTDVDVTVERDPAKLYQTVTFTQGEQIMSGETALIYIRSRKSSGDNGGDGARSQRQQQVIEALIKKITANETLENAHQIGLLYAYYQHHFARYIPMTKAIALARTLYPYKNNLKFDGQTLGIYPEDPQGSLVHPDPRQYNGQWLYTIRDSVLFTTEIKSKLNVP